MKTSILIIYTGGTIGMVKDPVTGSLKPFDFDHILKQVPELKNFGFELTSIAFDPLIDSSNLNPEVWIRIANLIKENYEKYEGFVVLHGTDTMAYSASALSFMLENLGKPVVFTGSQLPIGMLRTDGKENLITAIEIAADYKNGKAIVPEVCVLFENKLFRGNRTTKHNAEYFNAFYSYNYPDLAKVGINIHYNNAVIRNVSDGMFSINTNLDMNIAILKLFPGINKQTVDAILNIEGLRAVVMETYGAGNAPTDEWFIDSIKDAISRGVIIYNVTQCPSGSVNMGLYETGVILRDIGVVSGYDITTEGAITKLMFLLGQPLDSDKIIFYLNKSIKGELC
ncbi:asparaginase [Ancylomarina sp. 16SWW S1-10-2]|uniref:asparaginase n=1 Tax=Ancylomarina sp. 16SWW S1-10-2 TaxID=2499681 RepID=UPI0012AD2BEA|nr:type I asparaginase [Ancylomarina sp. 16SWW S1-10-2]MRT94157.1 type I asparaginase [Ancylomarina sp. 16SWW S1-10-2]